MKVKVTLATFKIAFSLRTVSYKSNLHITCSVRTRSRNRDKTDAAYSQSLCKALCSQYKIFVQSALDEARRNEIRKDNLDILVDKMKQRMNNNIELEKEIRERQKEKCYWEFVLHFLIVLRLSFNT